MFCFAWEKSIDKTTIWEKIILFCLVFQDIGTAFVFMSDVNIPVGIIPKKKQDNIQSWLVDTHREIVIERMLSVNKSIVDDTHLAQPKLQCQQMAQNISLARETVENCQLLRID